VFFADVVGVFSLFNLLIGFDKPTSRPRNVAVRSSSGESVFSSTSVNLRRACAQHPTSTISCGALVLGSR